jgi:hypothetical protein
MINYFSKACGSQSLASTYDYYGNGDKYIYAGSGRGYLSVPGTPATAHLHWLMK